MKFRCKCKETTHQCDKHQYKELRFFEMIMMKIHLVLCKPCRVYSKRNNRLTRTIYSADLRVIPEDEKIKLKNKLKAEINKTAKP